MRGVRLTTLLVASLTGARSVNTTIVFKLRANVASRSAAASAATAAAHIPGARRIFRHAGKFEKRHREYGLHLWYESDTVDMPDAETDAAVATLRKRTYDVEKVDVRPEARMLGFGNDGSASSPNDPRYSDQPALKVRRARPRGCHCPEPSSRAGCPAPDPAPPPRRRRAWWTWRPRGGLNVAKTASSSQ